MKLTTATIRKGLILGTISFLVLFFLPSIVIADKPSGEATKFVISKPSDSVVGTPVLVHIEAQTHNNKIDTSYQNNVTLVTSGFATGAGPVDIVDGVGTIEINDLIAETVVLSLADTEETGLEVDSTREITFSAIAPDEAVWHQLKFWFRDDDGTEITATDYGTGVGGVNTVISDVAPDSNFRLRFAIKATNASGNISPQIEYKEGTDCDPDTWTPITSSSSNFNLHLSSNFDDGEATTKQLASGQFAAGQILESTNPATSLAMAKNESTEYEWSLHIASEISSGATYAFRISNDGETLDNYEQCPMLTVKTPAAVPSGTVIGGSVKPTVLKISGRAYPGAQIFLVEKGIRGSRSNDGMAKMEVAVMPLGNFEISIIGIIDDRYAYSLLVEDKEGRQTQTKVYNADLRGIGVSLVVNDIFIPPTIDLARANITQGDFIKVVGNAFPGSKVNVQLDNDIIYETKANEEGSYQLLINTARLSFGRHTIRANQENTALKEESDFSLTRGFFVSASTVPKADFNVDGKIDITDWSIFLTFWQKQKNEGDLDENGKVDISDLSIFLRGVII